MLKHHNSSPIPQALPRSVLLKSVRTQN